MTTAAHEIALLARELGFDRPADPVATILAHCSARIGQWVAEAGGVSTVAQLELLVTGKLQMVFEEVWSDDDFARITETYARGKKDPVFATMKMRFDDPDNPTYGALVKRRSADADAPDRYVAVIDCRDYKALRRFFTRWHEIAHRLTTHADQGSGDTAYRSAHDPIERLMDDIAGHVGFYAPLFDPVFRAACAGQQVLTFDTVQRVIEGGFPNASFEATLHACARHLTTPVVYLEAKLGHNQGERKRIGDASARLFEIDEPPPPAQLRAVKVAANDAARKEKFLVPQNMRVPEESVIHQLFKDATIRDAAGSENMASWSDSKGKTLEARAVAVNARRLTDRVIAIVQPTEPVRPKSKRPERASLFE